MKRIILLLLSALCVICAMATTPNATDKKGRKQGAWSKTYANGQLMYEGSFKNGQPIGTFKRYFESGKLKLIQTYTKGDNSTVKIYEEDGKTISMEGAYKGKERDGEWKFYSEGKLSLVENYTNGKRNGIAKSYAKKGTVISETPYTNDKMNGTVKEFLEDGKLYAEISYKNGVKDGMYRLYEGNENPVVIGLYVNGEKDGNWVVYNNKGEVDETQIYKNGVLQNQKELKKKHTKSADENESEKGKIKEPTENFPGSSIKGIE